MLWPDHLMSLLWKDMVSAGHGLYIKCLSIDVYTWKDHSTLM